MRTVRIGERARKFLREVGRVVLGVLIALGLGTVADDIGSVTTPPSGHDPL